MSGFEPSQGFAEDADLAERATGGRALHRLTEPQVLFPLLAVLTLAVLWFATLHLARLELRNAQRTAAITTRELLDTYEAQVVRVLREIDQTLKGLEFAFEQSGSATRALDELERRDLLPPHLVFSVSVADTRGRLVASTRDDAAGTLLDARVVEAVRAATTTIELDPVLRGEERWLRFSRALAGPHGRFAGVAVVEVDAAFFVSGYDEGKLGDSGVLAVIGTDGVIRVRRSGDVVSYADTIPYAAIQAGDDFGETEAVLVDNPWDGVRRYTGARQLYAFPFAVIAGLAEDEQLSAARRRAGIYTAQAAIGSLFLLLVLLLLGRLRWKLEALRRREREYRAAHAARVEHLAYHDGLTGLPNRSFMAKLLDDRIRQASRFGRQFALLFLDLDGFKQINDALGHDAGDDLLREVAKRLEDALRRSDTVARMGGDEFMVLLPEVESPTQACIVARKIIAALAEPFMLLGEKFLVTASVGISVFPVMGRTSSH